jgi:hypothetical protein
MTLRGSTDSRVQDNEARNSKLDLLSLPARLWCRGFHCITGLGLIMVDDVLLLAM